MNIIAVDLEKLRARWDVSGDLDIGEIVSCMASRAEWQAHPVAKSAGTCVDCQLNGMPGALCPRHAAVDEIAAALQSLVNLETTTGPEWAGDRAKALADASAALAKAGKG